MELLLFEEPEAFLHPPQQDILDSNLRQFAYGDPQRQVIVATHSPHFVSYNAADISELAKFSRSKSSHVSQISREERICLAP